MEKSDLSWSEKVGYLHKIEHALLDGDENYNSHLPSPVKFHQVVLNLIEDPHVKVMALRV